MVDFAGVVLFSGEGGKEIQHLITVLQKVVPYLFDQFIIYLLYNK